jgi:N6-adenosine-specific RNA methylase IME4
MTESGNGEIPEFMKIVLDDAQPSSPRDVAERAVLALNDSMMVFYEGSLARFKENLRERVPIILALFSGQGGQMILYRPGREPEVAPRVPLLYELAKSVGHSTMAIYEVVSPYLTDAFTNQLWRPSLETYRTQHQTALNGLAALDVSEDNRDIFRTILEHNLAFMDECLANGGYTYETVKKYIRETVPHSIKTIGIGSGAQVGHWMNVIEGWQKELGDDWERTYAVSNSLYIARQNNILFSVLVQFMGTEAMGDRLLLVETPEFETTPEKMLDVLGRIVADRSLGMVFFNDYYLMDVELLGGGGRAAIENEMKKRGKEPLLPPLAPFRSNDWPWKTDPTKGTGPARMEDVHQAM